MLLPREIETASIDPDPDQPRQSMDEAALRELAASLRRFGVLQPLIVCTNQNRYRLVDGHRRLAAAGMAELTVVPAVVLPELPTEPELLMTQLAANCLRVDLRPTEKATAYLKLKKTQGWNNAELARALGVSKSAITQILALLTLPEDVRTRIDAGEIPVSTGYAIARAKDDDVRRDLVQQAAAKTLRRDDAARQASRRSSRALRHRSTFHLGDAEITVAASAEFDLPGCVTILKQLGRRCRSAARQGLNVATFAQVLKDQSGRKNSETEAEPQEAKQ